MSIKTLKRPGYQSVLCYWDADHQKISEETQPSTYDLRSRPWFSPALAIQGVFWTRPYIFFDRHVVGITASIGREVSTGKFQVVVAFDVLIVFVVPQPSEKTT